MQLFSKAAEGFRRLHRDERGDIPVGPLLIIGLIAIPLVIALISFGDAVLEWLSQQWKGLAFEDGPERDFGSRG